GVMDALEGSPRPDAPGSPGISSAPPPGPDELAVPESAPAPAFQTVRIAMGKLDRLLLQAEELLGVKQTVGERAAELRGVLASLELWRKEWMRARGAGRSRGVAPGSELSDFFAWAEGFTRSLDRKLTGMAKGMERDARTVGTMIDDLLDDAKRLVMLPFATLLDLFPKLVRDLAREQGKRVELEIGGREVEIDKRILEEMKDALIHLVRNAIDHGIETPEARERAGKAAQGSLRIAVSQVAGNKVEIIVADDGQGIDATKVRASAVKSGLISQEEAAQLEPDAALALIFRSGLSTSGIITEISGRGLGMAIVREKVEKLGGEIFIETRPGAGTSFHILLPVSLATFKGILVSAGGQRFVIPTASIERITRVPQDGIKTVENRETIALNGHALSLAWLSDVLERPRPQPANPGGFVEVVVLGAGDKRIAFAVDEVLHEQEVLVKTIGQPLVKVRNVAGATVLGSGTPVLILHAPDLLKSAVRLAAAGAPRGDRSATPEAESQARRIVVADDSVTSRMLLKNILESAGYHVTTAVDGADALAALRSGEFDLLVSDVEMPRLDGFELTAKVRADRKLAELPVVLVTALGSREHRERGIEVGADAYIVKSSFEQSNLLEILRKLL
ncbi:MAG: response regulator, partial [Verrucomicrobiota bacterium]|nr:response regulator [Verrucomicrobiota bacterium]